MGWAKTLLGRLTMWSSKKSSSESSSSSSPPPVFAVDKTEVAIATATCVPELTVRELNKVTRSFSAAMLIGRGQNDAKVVYRAMLALGTGKAAAVAKSLVLPPSGGTSWSADDDEFLRQQVLVLSSVRHDNVVCLLGYTIDTTVDVRVLLFEFADMGTLHDVLHGEPACSRPVLSWSQRTGIALDVARGLEYLHDAAAMARWGICSSKVLLFHGFRAKIADYDMSMRLPPDGNARVLVEDTADKGWYYPPEYVVRGCKTSREFDVYSYGLLLLELLTGRNTRDLRQLLAAPEILRDGRVEEFMDPKLGTQYPSDRALKVSSSYILTVYSAVLRARQPKVPAIHGRRCRNDPHRFNRDEQHIGQVARLASAGGALTAATRIDNAGCQDAVTLGVGLLV